MTLDEAKEECERWFDYLKSQEDKSIALQRLAADRRSGRCDAKECQRRMAEIQGNGLTVYDGANLHDAVKTLLRHVA